MEFFAALYEVALTEEGALLAAVMGTVCIGVGYFQGPGWLAHSRCPHCCWCSSRIPLGNRIEERTVEWLSDLR